MTGRRFGRIAFGYVLASLVASALVTALMFYTLHFFGPEQYTAMDIVRAGWDMSRRGVMLTFLPSALLLTLAEIYSWRNLLAYELAGVVLPLPLVYGFDSGLIVEICAIGAASGLVYWAAAGRKAGT